MTRHLPILIVRRDPRREQVGFQELTQSLAGQHLLGYLYDAADHGRPKAKLQNFVEDACMLGMVEKVAELKPSAIVCTHFLPAQLFAGIRARSEVLKRRLPIGAVLVSPHTQPWPIWCS